MASAQPKTEPIERTARTVAQHSRKVAQTAAETKHAAAAIEESADLNARLAADRNILAAERTYAAWVRTGLFALARYENLSLKLTTHNVHDAPADFLVRAVKRFGAERVAWGSNFPAAKGPLAKLLAEGHEALAKLSGAEREWVFGRTARAIYRQ